MVITEASARALLLALGYDNAAKFSLKIVAERLRSAGELPAERRARVTNAQQRRLLTTLLSASLTDGVEVRPSPQAPPDRGFTYERTEAAKSRRPDAKCVPGNEPDPYATGKVKRRGRRRKGVQFHVFEKLLAGTPEAPVSKDEILEHLRKVFPKRSVAGMAQTVNCFPTWLPIRYAGYEVVMVRKSCYYVRKADL